MHAEGLRKRPKKSDAKVGEAALDPINNHIEPDDSSSDEPERETESSRLVEVEDLKVDIFVWDTRSLSVLAFLVVAGLVSRMYRVHYPAVVLFDEVHFVSMAQWYASRKYFFDIHPPLGKLLLAAVVWASGFHTDVPYRDIGKPYEHDAYIWMRLTQSFYGSWLPSIAFLTLRQLRVSLPAAAMGGLLVLFELSFQTISRAIFLDPFLHLSIGLSFLSAVTLWNTRDRKMFWILTVSCGFWMGCAFSTKHTGLGVIGVVGVTHLIKTILPVFSNKFQTREGLLPLTPPRHHNKPQPLMERIENVLGGDMFLSGVVMLVLISFVYYMCFVIHFIVIKYAGVDQDSMPDAYLNTLIGNNITSALGQPAPSMFECIVHINRHMLKVNDATSFQHHHASQWQEWPLHYRGLVYWWRDVPESPGYHRCVYLFGNPLVYWLVLVGVLGSLYLIDKKLWCHFFEKIPMAPRQLALVTSGALCAFGWVANYLPYPLLVRRTCFVYHYHPSLYFGILCTAIVFDLLIHHMRTARRNLAWIATFVLVLGPILLTYFYYLPFSYALPLTDDEHEQRRKLYFFDSLRRLFPVW